MTAKLEGDDPAGLSDLLDSRLEVLPGVLVWLGGSIRSAGSQTDATSCVQGPQTHTPDFPPPICPVSSKVRYGDRVAKTEQMHRRAELFLMSSIQMEKRGTCIHCLRDLLVSRVTIKRGFGARPLDQICGSVCETPEDEWGD